ncbi:unnamed protein product [Didymodactylos carnosus]|uniref:Uncharacterized protein n=1 Tax=Didymodactylos carnosus TaxID=1234261 RepID=A0A815ECK3_9BILA|nr:unnamed protein product [Didymodactylos carnosus]CAF4147726.1 unnamed protein product [Didymodactylos carnosus]
MSCFVRFQLFRDRIKTSLISFNIYDKYPSENQHVIANERIATRIYVILMTLALLVIILFTSFTHRTVIKQKNKPNQLEFDKLYAKYSHKLVCPCSQISILYDTFIMFEPELHTICSSDFISINWISYLASTNETYYNHADFRILGQAQFNALLAFCQLANQTISDAMNTFLSTNFISSGVIKLELFQSEVEFLLKSFKSSTINSFQRSFDLIRLTTQGNQLLSALKTNYIPIIDTYNVNSSIIGFESNIYFDLSNSSCSCSDSPMCIEPVWIFSYNETTQTFIKQFNVPGFYTGCFAIESLFQSTFKCLFNQSCLEQIKEYVKSYATTDISILNLSSSSKYEMNTTIGTIIYQLFIENWNTHVFYEAYYNSCQPMYCSYDDLEKFDVLSIITSILSVYGGLTVVLKILLLYLVKFIRNRTQSVNTNSCMTNPISFIGTGLLLTCIIQKEVVKAPVLLTTS